MSYRVRHKTEYRYAEGVSISHHEVHLYPRFAPGQMVRDKRLDVFPEPALRRDRIDWFGNPTTHLEIHGRHTRLAVTSSFVVDIARAPPPHRARVGRARVRGAVFHPGAAAGRGGAGADAPDSRGVRLRSGRD
jgi:transglutaminase-like putative cysteine protease